jgi:hemerythrin
MAYFAWDPGLETGRKDIDDQHKGLFALANSLERSIESRSHDEAAVADAVYGLVDYVVEHFRDEEQLMAECHYPGLVPHRSLHEQLSAETLGVMARYVNGELESPAELAPMVCDWLRGHIGTHDMGLVVFMSRGSIGAEMSAIPPRAPGL